MSTMTNKSVALTLAAGIALTGALALGASSPGKAAPVFASPLAVKEAAPNDVIDVRRRRWRRGGALAAGIALGFIGAHALYGPRYYRVPRKYRRSYYRPRRPACIRAYGDIYCRY